MNLALFQQKLPEVLGWIDHTLAEHAANARSVASLGLPRLASYYSPELLASSSFIPVPKIPMPPLAAMGLPGFDEFEQLDAGGITFRTSYFILEQQVADEALHFHELVHVVQWQHLRPERFVLAYALGHLLAGGYRQNPLEQMAYSLEDHFKRGVPPFDVAAIIRRELDRVVPSLFTAAAH